MPEATNGAGARADAEPWYAPGLRFSCTQCGNCCTGPPGYVWFDEDEAEAMAREVGVEVDAFYRTYAKHKFGRWTLEEVKVGRKYDCVFLTRDEKTGQAGCSIYKARPTQCRTWPFWDSNLKSRRAWAGAAKGCPGMALPDEERGTFVPIEDIRVRLNENPSGL